MPLQQSLVRESLVTHVALEGLLATVEPHVHVKGALLGKAFIAHRTLVRSHACVRHHVLYQVVPERERTPAHAALMRLLTCGGGGERKDISKSETSTAQNEQ